MHKTARDSTHAPRASVTDPADQEARKEARKRAYQVWKKARTKAVERAEATLQALGAEPYVDLDTAAAFLCLKPAQIYEAVSLYGLPSTKLGKLRRFKVSELEAWAQAHHEGNGK